MLLVTGPRCGSLESPALCGRTGSTKSWWNRIGWSASWRRDGNQIRILTDRNWDFEGQLDGETIRGQMLIRDQPGGKVVTTTEVVWQRENE
jgi:hypothetical protein